MKLILICIFFVQNVFSSSYFEQINLEDKNENTINMVHTMEEKAEVEDAEADVQFCEAGGDQVCSDVGPGMKGMGSAQNAAINDRRALWLKKKVKYSFAASAFDASKKAVVRAVIREIESKSCVRFQQIANHEPDSIYITNLHGMCAADVGRRSYRGYQRLMLGSVCFEYKGFGIVLHEMMHALGFFHEMARPDRDSHVMINWNNIQSGMNFNFEKYPVSKTDTLGLPYDYDSIMHYGRYDFSKGTTRATVDTLRPFNGQLGQRNGLSQYDILKLNKAYQCGGANSLEVKPNKAPKVISAPKTKVVSRPTSQNQWRPGYNYYWNG